MLRAFFVPSRLHIRQMLLHQIGFFTCSQAIVTAGLWQRFSRLILCYKTVDYRLRPLPFSRRHRAAVQQFYQRR
jgi:hypothetical protein